MSRTLADPLIRFLVIANDTGVNVQRSEHHAYCENLPELAFFFFTFASFDKY